MNPEDVLNAFRRAHEAGDTEAAAKLAKLYEQMRDAAQQPEMDMESGSIADPLGKGLTFGFADEIAGAGGATVNSLMNLFGAGTGESWGDAYTGIRDAARYNEQAFAARNPGTALAAELAGGLLTGGAGAARVGALKGGQSLGRLAGIGAAEGGLYGLGASEADTLGGLARDTAVGAGFGGVGGAVLPAAGRAVGGLLRRGGDDAARAATAAADDVQGGVAGLFDDAGRLTDEGIEATAEQTARRGPRYQQDVDLLRENGITLTTGQRTGSTGAKAFETTIDKTLWGGAIDATFDKQRRQLQTRLMEMAGFPEDIARGGLITDDAIEAAGRRLSQEYTAALKGKAVNLGDDFIDDLASIEARHSRLLTPQQRREVRVLVDDFLEEAIDGNMSGNRYQRLRSFVGERSRKLKMSNPIISDLFGDMRDALDNAFLRSTGSTNRSLNTKFAQFKQLETVWRRGGGAAVSQGQLPLASLNALAKKSPGSREWRRLLNAASAVLGDATPNSGTASRLANLSTTQRLGDLMTGGVPTFMANQLMARGVGGSVPQRVGGLLNATGRGVQQGGQLLGATAGPVGVAAIPGLLADPDLPQL